MTKRLLRPIILLITVLTFGFLVRHFEFDPMWEVFPGYFINRGVVIFFGILTGIIIVLKLLPDKKKEGEK